MSDVHILDLGWSIEALANTSFGQEALLDELELRHEPCASRVKIYFHFRSDVAKLCQRLLLDGLSIGIGYPADFNPR